MGFMENTGGKVFMVAGTNWVATVNIENYKDYNKDQIWIEAATRGVEKHFNKRNDVDIEYREPDYEEIKEKFPNMNKIDRNMLELKSTELEKGCGIGGIICINGEEENRFIMSKFILENVGIPHLVDVFNKKYPNPEKTFKK